jgi:hypothetical protein
MSTQYRIWDIRRKRWWKDRGMGYTTEKSEAGIYEQEDAMQTADPHTSEYVNLHRVETTETDMMRTRDDMEALLRQWMIENFGSPVELTHDVRERWHRDFGLIFHFICDHYEN